jgi:hypothetical protein
LEGFDSLGPNIAESTLCGFYKAESFGTFIGIKTEKAAQNRVTPASYSDEFGPTVGW